jgi:Tfp pilus assembly protein PilV
MSDHHDDVRTAGFSTIEAVIALAIVGIVLVSLLDGITTGAQGVQRATARTNATVLLTSALARGDLPLPAAESAATSDNQVSRTITRHARLKGYWVTVRTKVGLNGAEQLMTTFQWDEPTRD